MSYQLYRNTTLGHTLQESLDELVQYNQLTPALALKILLQFDRSMNNALANKVKSRLTFKAGKLHTYRFCDNVWTFLLNDVEFREVHEVARVDKGDLDLDHREPIFELDLGSKIRSKMAKTASDYIEAF
ncbi:Transcription initiation factor IIA subunit 2 [Folsomia candida]|uniref:Transcription initiation factor IIA subunit 2 n=1 Tax=Folsomia candida TaxID=158441 RepID=A0A226D3T7_FOLCA|nr:Transcription initiation factor IIA subunit 2 [Folsomia candida]